MKNIDVEVNYFMELLQDFIKTHYTNEFSTLPIPEVTMTQGKKYYKLVVNSSVWGFISKYDGVFKKAPIKVGDLMKGANWSSPAKHARGNILNGTASYSVYGPSYLK